MTIPSFIHPFHSLPQPQARARTEKKKEKEQKPNKNRSEVKRGEERGIKHCPVVSCLSMEGTCLFVRSKRLCVCHEAAACAAPSGLAPSVVYYGGGVNVVVCVDTLGLAPSWSSCMVYGVCMLFAHFRLVVRHCRSERNKRSNRRGEKKTKQPGDPSPQILATLAFPSGTLAWQTINFKLVPHSSHSASSALSRHMLPPDDGPIAGSAALS